MCVCVFRRETLQRADKHAGSGEDVRFWDQRLPGGLGGQNYGRWLQTLHGGKFGNFLMKERCVISDIRVRLGNFCCQIMQNIPGHDGGVVESTSVVCYASRAHTSKKEVRNLIQV